MGWVRPFSTSILFLTILIWYESFWYSLLVTEGLISLTSFFCWSIRSITNISSSCRTRFDRRGLSIPPQILWNTKIFHYEVTAFRLRVSDDISGLNQFSVQSQ